MKKIYIALSIALCLLIGLFLYSGRERTLSSQNFRLGTIIRMQITGQGKNFTKQELKKADDEIIRLENLFSANIASSDISRLNNSDGEWCAVSNETFSLVKFALEISQKTDGAFDIAIGRVVRLWGIGTDAPRVPSDAEITSALSAGNFRDVKLKEANGKYFIKIPSGMMLDLGAVAKGRIADIITDMLIKDGVKHILLDFGGNIAAAGGSPNGSPNGRAWVIGLQNPEKTRGNYFARAEIVKGSVVTSGGYERYFEHKGVKYHHIFDTQTGRPADNEISSVSIINENSALADALSTSLFVMGKERAEAFAEKEKIAAVIVYRDGKIFMSSDAKKITRLAE